MVWSVKEKRETKEDLHVAGNAGQLGRGAGSGGTKPRALLRLRLHGRSGAQAELSGGQVVVQLQAGGRC